MESVTTPDEGPTMFRSSDHRGNPAIPVNAAIVGSRLVPDMPIPDALQVFAESEEINEFAASVRRHPAWNPALENDPRWAPDPEWTTPEIRFAREVLIRALRAYGPQDLSGLTHLRDDGRREVADHPDANDLYCPIDEWCILDADHHGECNGDRQMWMGAGKLYPTPALAHA